MHVTVQIPGALRSEAGGASRLDLDLEDGATLGSLTVVILR